MVTKSSSVFYEDGDFIVTDDKVKSPTKTYRLDKIEKVSLRRDPFYISVVLSVFVTLFILKFGKGGSIIPFALIYFLFSSVFFRMRPV